MSLARLLLPAHVVLTFGFAIAAGLLVPTHAFPREFGEVRWGRAERIVRLPVDQRSWLSYGPGRVAGYVGRPGVIERPVGFEFHRGAINLGGR